MKWEIQSLNAAFEGSHGQYTVLGMALEDTQHTESDWSPFTTSNAALGMALKVQGASLLQQPL